MSRADADRLRAFVTEVGRIGRDPRGGWSRLAFSEEERDAHRVFERWAREIGLSVRTDRIGNTIAESTGNGAALAVGSHLDTVPQGGNFDGVAGVAAGLEVARLLSDRNVTVIAFAAEEGARFGAPCLGSKVAVGTHPLENVLQLRDQDGVTVEEAATRVGLDPRGAPDCPWPPDAIEMFVELHIEQGRILESRGRQVAIVDAIGGSTRVELTFSGSADHSGATPMRLRRDALACASEFIAQVELSARKHPTTVATVGRLAVEPGSITTVPGVVRLSLDVRDIDSRRQRDLMEALLDDAFKIASRREIRVSADLLSDQSPVLLHWIVRQRLAKVSTALGIPFCVMPSGASHDAAQLARITPTGLLFIPCKGGISHAPAESASFDDISRGVEVIARAFTSVATDG
jgi:allantoate deiminase